MLNRALLVGRLTKDPELRRTGSGKAVTSFNLAVERNFKSDDQEADFINCVCWGKIAENTERYCSKGSMVSVDGRIQTRNYENNQGQKVYVTEVIADSVQFINTRNNNTATAAQTPVNNYVPDQPIQQFEDDELVMDEEDIQF
ncbi:MAG: single-stranded DNA-binding protein [Catenibacterium mitsuokai]|nr:single-stranded DNA-binding protein [Catenibacterium mitsuokai]MBN2931304.1 single-stranded DNA-binding protein [Catenibacterium mitsuokai]